MAKLTDLPPELHTIIAYQLIPLYNIKSAWPKDDICALALISRYWKDIAHTAVNQKQVAVLGNIVKRQKRHLKIATILARQEKRVMGDDALEDRMVIVLKMEAFVSMITHRTDYLTYLLTLGSDIHVMTVEGKTSSTESERPVAIEGSNEVC